VTPTRACRNYGQAESEAAQLKKENEALRLAATRGTAQPPTPPQQPPPVGASYDSYATDYTSTPSTYISTPKPDAGKPKLLFRIMVTLLIVAHAPPCAPAVANGAPCTMTADLPRRGLAADSGCGGPSPPFPKTRKELV
jgi:hypothetical protein